MSRLFKIYPPYLFALGLFISVLGITLNERFDLFVYIVGLQFVFANVVKPILTLWYVGAIILFYFIFALLWRAAPKSAAFVPLALFLFLFAFLLNKTTNLLDVRFFEYYLVFLTGMLLARQNHPSLLLSSQWIPAKAALAVFGVWFFSFAVSESANPISIAFVSAAYIFIVSAALLLFALISRLRITSLWTWVNHVSYASYFVYLFHRPFWRLIEGFVPIENLQNQIFFRLVPASALVVVTCYFLQRFYDSALAHLKRQISRPGLSV
ncbi:MAG: acyltransferase [Anaerolineales bacterium]|nr:MAG: acyltransferase [Anaerolineales bacterium]